MDQKIEKMELISKGVYENQAIYFFSANAQLTLVQSTETKVSLWGKPLIFQSFLSTRDKNLLLRSQTSQH